MDTPTKQLISFSPENLPKSKEEKNLATFQPAHLGVRVSVDKR